MTHTSVMSKLLSRLTPRASAPNLRSRSAEAEDPPPMPAVHAPQPASSTLIPRPHVPNAPSVRLAQLGMPVPHVNPGASPSTLPPFRPPEPLLAGPLAVSLKTFSTAHQWLAAYLQHPPNQRLASDTLLAADMVGASIYGASVTATPPLVRSRALARHNELYDFVACGENLGCWVRAAPLDVRPNYCTAAARIGHAWQQQTMILELAYLDLANLPDCIGELEHIKILDIRGNALVELPTGFLNLHEEVVIYLQSNVPITLSEATSCLPIKQGLSKRPSVSLQQPAKRT